MIDTGGEKLVTHEDSRKVKHYVVDEYPCKTCIAYAVCQNNDIVSAIEECKNLCNAVIGTKGTKLNMTVSGIRPKTGEYNYYIYSRGGYIGNFWGDWRGEPYDRYSV
jgi:hypothetical protein